MSSKVSCGFREKNFRNSFNEPRFHALDCCMPRMVIAFRQVGILFGPKAPMNDQPFADLCPRRCEGQTSRVFDCTCQDLHKLVIWKLAIRVSF